MKSRVNRRRRTKTRRGHQTTNRESGNASFYYIQKGGGYEVTVPTIGISVAVIPEDAELLAVNNQAYFYFNGAFYEQADAGYRVIRAPIGAIVESIPEVHEKVRMEGTDHFVANGVTYKPLLVDGELQYKVVAA